MSLDFSICTPVYNRAHLLPRLYESLKLSCSEGISFEWLIVDDGSTDDIHSFIKEVESEGLLNYRYIRKENQGKHSCMNVFFKEAKGELTLILDSDDLLAPNALKEANKIWKQISKQEKFAGIIGLCIDLATQKPSAQEFPKDPMESTILENAYKYNMKGDRCDFIRTSLLKGKAFPVYSDERFMPEAVVMTLFDADKKYYCTNSAFKIIEYQADGLTNSYDKLAMRNPKGMCLRFQLILENINLIKLPSGKNKLKFYGNYMRYLCHRDGVVKALVEYCKIPKFFLLNWFIGAPVGSVMYVKDKLMKGS